MLAKSMVAYTELDALKRVKQKTVLTAVIFGILLATLVVLLTPILVPLAKLGMYPLVIGISLVSAALLRKHQGISMWELSIIGQGISMISVTLFIAAIIL